MARPTMSVHDVCEAFRANQIPMGEDLISGAIVAEAFWSDRADAWAYVIKDGEEGGNRRFLIFRDKFYAWLGAQLGHPPIRAYEGTNNA